MPEEKRNPRLPNGYFLVPIFSIIGYNIYLGNYIHQEPFPTHKSIYTVNSLQSYFATYFWQTHGVMRGTLLLLGTFFLPRTTMWWFSLAIPSGWASSGWYIAPRITLAFLMTTVYWHTNPELCVLTGLMAYGAASLKVDWLRDKLGEDVESLINRVAEIAVKGLVVIAVLGVLSGGLYLGLWLLVKLSVALVIGVGDTKAIYGGIVGVLVIGSCLYMFRHVSRLWYGITEIIAAMVLAYYTILQRAPSPDEKIANLKIFATVLALSSSIYIVVRGLDNIGYQNLKDLYIKLAYLSGRITLFVSRK